MILEVVDILIPPDAHQAFELAVARGVRECIAPAQGFISYQLHPGIENPHRYLLHICWNSLEDHTVGFRQSDAFTQWRSIVGPFFAKPPLVEHFNCVHPT